MSCGSKCEKCGGFVGILGCTKCLWEDAEEIGKESLFNLPKGDLYKLDLPKELTEWLNSKVIRSCEQLYCSMVQSSTEALKQQLGLIYFDIIMKKLEKIVPQEWIEECKKPLPPTPPSGLLMTENNLKEIAKDFREEFKDPGILGVGINMPEQKIYVYILNYIVKKSLPSVYCGIKVKYVVTGKIVAGG